MYFSGPTTLKVWGSGVDCYREESQGDKCRPVLETEFEIYYQYDRGCFLRFLPGDDSYQFNWGGVKLIFCAILDHEPVGPIVSVHALGRRWPLNGSKIARRPRLLRALCDIYLFTRGHARRQRQNAIPQRRLGSREIR